MDTNKIFKNFRLRTPHSMQSRVLAIALCALFSITIFIGGLSIYEMDQYIQSQTEDFVKVTCAYEAEQINASFGDMEKSVNIMESYVMGFFTSKQDAENNDLREKAIKSAEEMFSDVAEHTNGAIAYYVRFSPFIADSKSGLFYSKQGDSDKYIQLEPTDILLYEKEDTEHVGWFWQPYEAGHPIWMKPYYNQNNNILMISYVVPMYYEDMFIGVVGMDFDYQLLSERVHNIQIYETGLAHLEMGGVTICDHGNEEYSERREDSKQYMQVSEKLVNGMTLVLSANYDDIRQLRYGVAFKIVLGVLILSAFFTVVAIVLVKKMVEPIKKLTHASEKLSKGDYDVEIEHSNTHEIRLLSTAFENMIMHLREREELLHLSANRDSLTGLRNTTSYKSWVEGLDEKIQNEKANFGVVVLDINALKDTNDQYGHDVGNELIMATAQILSGVFARSPVFRIGGDEFLVILQNSDLENHEKLFEQFYLQCANTFIEKEKVKIPISIAKGFAMFDSKKDAYFIDVFKRADDAMYENKRQMKMV